jgi:hypothetical protein
MLTAIALFGVTETANASPVENTAIPTRIESGYHPASDRVLLPDWNQISFGNLPNLTNSGNWGERNWQKDTEVDRILHLGDISDLKPEILSLSAIEQLATASIPSDRISLTAFPLAGKQTIGKLTEIVPNLNQFSLSEVAPIATLSQRLGLNYNDNSLTLSQAVKQFPQLAQAKLNQIDLSEFSLDRIPNLSSVSLEQFSGFQEEIIGNIPNLSSVPFSSFPVPVAEFGSTVMRIDTIYGAAESKRHNTISGSNVEGFAVKCESDCAYIELDDLENIGAKARSRLEGKQWISGKYQEVRGGSGCLTGWEPTGRHPFGEAFKVVLMEPSEESDSVDTALYFRFTLPCGKSPYIIGPVPFLNYKLNAPIFVGKLEPSATSNASRSTGATKPQISKSPLSSPPQSKKPTQNSQRSNQPNSDCDRALPATYVSGIDVASLGEAIAAADSAGNENYETIGAYTCKEGAIDCSRKLGRYQLASDREDLQQTISSVPGGTEFLQRVNSGKKPTAGEIFQYLPPAVQDKILHNSLARSVNTTQQEIDPTTGQLFKGERLIERIAQKHFGGNSSKVDASYSDILDGYSLKLYGEKVSTAYKHNSTHNTCNSTANNSANNSYSDGSGLNLKLSVSWLKNLSAMSLALAALLLFSKLFLSKKLPSFLMRVALGIAAALATATFARLIP